MVFGFWAMGPGDKVAGRGPPARSRAQGKAPAMKVELLPLAETDKELANLL